MNKPVFHDWSSELKGSSVVTILPKTALVIPHVYFVLFGLFFFFETRAYYEITSNKRHSCLDLLSAGITPTWLDMFKFLGMIRKYPFVPFSFFLQKLLIRW